MPAKNILKLIFIQLMIPILAVILSLGIGSLVILIVGGDPIKTFKDMLLECFTTGYGFGQVLQKTTQLIFTGMAVAIAFRGGIFNIGAEGQMTIGAFCIGIAGTFDYGLPKILTIILCIFAGMAGGAVWGGIPGWLKSRFGAHEVITTIMMNFIAFALVNWLIEIPGVAMKETVHTYSVLPNAQLPKLDSISEIFAGSTGNFSFFLAIFCAIAGWFYLFYTKPGYELRATGLNPLAAETYGISTRKVTFFTMALSGAIASLAGADFVLGYKHYFELDFSTGVGFMGIAVALLARNHPIAVIPSAFLFGILAYGKITLGVGVPKELIEIIQAIVIIMVVVLTAVGRRITRNI